MIRDCLHEFGRASALEVNFVKSKLFVSPINGVEVSMLSSTRGTPLTDNLETYLGVPIIHGRVNYETYAPDLVDMLLKRLTDWKGRKVLIQSTSAAIPLHSMETALLLISVCDKLDRLNSNFLWGGSTEYAHNHLISWDQVCGPKHMGGLGLRKARTNNLARLAKASSRLHLNHDVLWCKVFRNKYFNMWLANKPICQKLDIPDAVDRYEAASAFLSDSGTWNLTHFLCQLFEQSWFRLRLSGLTSNGLFTVQPAYKLAASLDANQQVSVKTGWIWRLDCPERLRFFHLINTNQMRVRKNMTNNASCLACGNALESASHLFHDCSILKEIWSGLQVTRLQPDFFSSDFEPADRILGCVLLITILWGLWKNRNKRVSKGSRGFAVAGGSIQNESAEWIKGYQMKIRVTNSLQAELWSVRQGLILGKELGIRRLIVEVDALLETSILLILDYECWQLIMKVGLWRSDIRVLVGRNIMFFFLICVFGWSLKLSEAQMVPALFVFGDSQVDVGNNNHLFFSIAKANFPHNGVDFPTKKATGRYSNGKNAADFLAEKLGLSSSPAYLSLSSNTHASYMNGVSFASGGSGILNTSSQVLGQSIPLSDQVNNFLSVHKVMLQKMGTDGLERHFSKSLFAIVIGSNDILNYFESEDEKDTPEHLVNLMVNNLKAEIKKLYGFGARKILVSGVGAVGCVPAQRAKHSTHECNEEVNMWVVKYNEGLKEVLKGLKIRTSRPKLRLPRFVWYHAKSHPRSIGSRYKYITTFWKLTGFKEVRAACCGLGELRAKIPCLPFSSYCPNRADHVFWDLYHPTEAMSRIVADTVFDGPSEYCVPMNVRQLIAA
ncbi:hypothetical protein CXB51_034275 [Gossypium anomalum]|uniref:Uncharacterized protein n=1 Tax=Gossypium anomalum TaxID=47600 RepID=A0A8J5Y0Z6_9ROSI|nr:hypothetical protein CXB51_034275 [Gossypium anomalum]